jgi:hypothetical protein
MSRNDIVFLYVSEQAVVHTEQVATSAQGKPLTLEQQTGADVLAAFIEGMARSGIPHAVKCGRHSLVHFVLEAQVEMPPNILPRAVTQYIFV